MHRLQLHKSSIKHNLSLIFLSQSQIASHLFSSKPHNNKHRRNEIERIDPERVRRLIASQTDPLLAKEIFDFASKQPNFRHSQSSYLVLILKLGRSKYVSIVDDILARLKAQNHPLSPTLFYYLIKVYGEADLPDKALRVFYTMVELNSQPSTQHLNSVLKILFSRRSHVRTGLELFKTANKHGVEPDTESYNVAMRGLCLVGDLSIAYKLFDKMPKRGLVRDQDSYRILMQGLSRRGQIGTASQFLEEMVNKGLVPDGRSYTTVLNGLCRKKRLREAYKLLCRMKVKGCNPDVVHYNTVITGFCREGRAGDARKVLEDMEANGCLPDSASYRTLVDGLCREGRLDEARWYVAEMVCKGFSPHFSTVHGLVGAFCRVGRVGEAGAVVTESLGCEVVIHWDTWMEIVLRVCEDVGPDELDRIVQDD